MSHEYQPNATIFVPDEVHAYVPQRVISCRGHGVDAEIVVSPLGGGATNLLTRSQLEHTVEADPLALDGANDMVKFNNLTEAALLHNLRARYERDEMCVCLSFRSASLRAVISLGAARFPLPFSSHTNPRPH